MVLGGYVCEIPPTGGNAFIHSTTNMIISMTMRPGTLLNFRELHMALACYLITLIYLSIYGTCSAAEVILRVDLPGIIILIF